MAHKVLLSSEFATNQVSPSQQRFNHTLSHHAELFVSAAANKSFCSPSGLIRSIFKQKAVIQMCAAPWSVFLSPQMEHYCSQ